MKLSASENKKHSISSDSLRVQNKVLLHQETQGAIGVHSLV